MKLKFGAYMILSLYYVLSNGDKYLNKFHNYDTIWDSVTWREHLIYLYLSTSAHSKL